MNIPSSIGAIKIKIISEIFIWNGYIPLINIFRLILGWGCRILVYNLSGPNVILKFI